MDYKRQIEIMKIRYNWCGIGIDGVWWDDGKGEGYFYKTIIKEVPTRFIGFNIRFGFFRLCFGKENKGGIIWTGKS